jgi:prepilin-type N-terminal cleavage/methylation domain-containing protein
MAEATHNRSGGLQAARLSQRGFTLIEITVTVLIIGLMLMIVVTGTYFAFRDRETLKGEARALAGFLEHVRTLAATKGKTYKVEYNLKEQQYFVWVPRKAEEGEIVEGDDEDAYVAGAYFQMPSRTSGSGERRYSCWIDRITFGDGRTSKDESVVIMFEPKGGTSWHYVYLTNQDEEYYTIELNPFTGAADYVQGEAKVEPPERLK